ncbi:transporter [Pseudozobellia sp. WGM2]|uniref:transporter n=1 Tax=Pseudozobellia sp. WGM2 TaxID=2787625 RepID=UPI001ADFBCDE|nr:transporter [Pseudozobellia sp. WGM2]
MKLFKLKISIGTLVLFGAAFSANSLAAQGLIDGFYSNKGDVSLTASYTGASYDEFYVGEEKMGPVPAHEKITQDIIGLYAKWGLTDALTLVVNAPYISAKGEGTPDPISGNTKESGFQDISIAAKYRPFRAAFEGGKFDGITALGFDIPGGYDANSILAIGNGAFKTNLHIGGHLQLNQGFFTTLVAGYSLRGKTDDDFNVNNGEDYDVPNAILAMAKVGYAGSKFYGELWVDHQATSSDGVDIMGPGFAGNFPETRVNYTRLGVSAYVPVTTLIGLSAGYGTLIDGRNIGDTNFFNVGVTFSFNTQSTAMAQ